MRLYPSSWHEPDNLACPLSAWQSVTGPVSCDGSVRWPPEPPKSPPAAICGVRRPGLMRDFCLCDGFRTTAAMNLLATGRYLTIFPASALDYQSRMRGLRALPVDLPMAHVANGVVTLKNRTVSPAGQLFIERARELADKRVRKNS